MRILFLQKRLVLPANTGGKIRTLNVLRYLAQWHEITYLSNLLPEEQASLAQAHGTAEKFLRSELTELIPPDCMGLTTDKYRVQLWRTGKDSVYLRIKRMAV